MALQGTLETFSVPEVLRLLSSTKKTGMLAIDGDRGSGKVWLGDGSIISARSDHESNSDIDATLFDLLRYSTGDFVFDAGATPDHPVSDEVDVEDALAHAETLLEEWHELETVVPSLLVGVRLAKEIEGDSVTITADQWRSIAAVGAGTSAAGLGQRLELGELDTCRTVRDLVEASLIELTDDVHEPSAPVTLDLDLDLNETSDDVVSEESVSEEYVGYDDELQLVDHDLSHDEVVSLSNNLAGFVARPVEDTVDDRWSIDDPDGEVHVNGIDLVGDDAATDPARDWSEAVDRGDDVDDVDDVEEGDGAAATMTNGEHAESADEFLAQLTNLSPKAAAAIEATAEEAAGRTEDREAGQRDLDPAPNGDEEINRNLLLKFLSSTKN